MGHAGKILIVVAVLVAGCAEQGNDVQPAGVIIDEDRPEPAFNDIPNADLGELALPDLLATLAAPPVLQEGEWWRIELHDTISDTKTQFVRVVARVEEDSDACDASSPQADACGLYVFGMPHEGWWKEAVVFHAPAFGDVNKDLSHRAHDVPFQPLVFPLVEGATWPTNWEDEIPVTATVAVESPTTARVTFTSPDCGMFFFVGQCPSAGEEVLAEIVYDATIHEIAEATFYSHTWRVIEHGYGFEGWVTVPRGEELVFFHARMGASVYDPWYARANTPTDTALVEGGFNRVSFLLGAGNFAGPGDGGAYSEKAIAPDGTKFELSMIPGAPMRMAFFEHADPDGEWTIEHLAAGPGIVFIEGIAYHQYDIRVPDGAVRSDHAHDVVR